MKHSDWAHVTEEQLNPLVSRRMIHGETMTVARLSLRQGATVPLHSHPNEQITLLESGKLRFVVDGVERVISGGQTLQIPPHAEHMVEALEDSLATDVFSPPREDWIRGDDAYLRAKS